MSSKRAEVIAIAFRARVDRLNATRLRVESAVSRGSLLLSDAETTYAGLFLQMAVAYEAAVEDFVLGLLVRPGGLVSDDRTVRGSVTVRSYAHALQIAAGPGGRYAAWNSRADLEKIADLVLRDGAPFKALPPVSWHYVEQTRYVRNAIAHPSDHAMAQFQRHVLQSRNLPPRERRVAGFLRGRSTAGPQTRWEIHAAGLTAFVASVIH